MVKLTLRQRKTRNGLLYILPWLIGMAVFFIPALFQTFLYSFSRVDAETFRTTFIGFDNFYRAFQGDKDFPPLLADILLSNLRNIPLTLIFSYLVALLLKKPFRGISAVKAIFFMTVILSSDMFIAMQVETSDIALAQTQGVLENATAYFDTLSGGALYDLMDSFGISGDIILQINNIIGGITDVFIRSGVQIFIFLAGLSSIPESMYEAASMEGATAWESFWKITFPMTTPIIMVGFVYTVVDSFNSMLSPTMQYIYDMGFGSGKAFGYSSAMTVIYFLIVAVVVGMVFLATRKHIFFYA